MEIYINKDDKDDKDDDDKDDNLLLDDESLKRELDEIIPESSDKKIEEDESFKDKLISNTLKTIDKVITGEGSHFNKIKIDENLLKKIF